MDYRMVTDTTSPQYALIQTLNNRGDGILVDSDNHVAVALGSYYGAIGSKYLITFDNGNQVKIIKADEKSDKDVINGCYHASNNSIMEFVVDTNTMDPFIKDVMGDFNYHQDFKGTITKIEKEVMK
ncbi:hypothetical protein [Anaerorhabdus sp.]|uniref:hypothetical protein n=1 Tax=Anaerorhabdus sp. TaxID=1872524 RepID=UPI002FC773EE